MKTKNLICLLIVFCCSPSCFSQFVYIPDSTFRNLIRNNVDATAIVGDSLDTTNVNVVSRKHFSASSYTHPLINLSGIQYFDSLETLSVRFTEFTGLSVLPRLIKKISMYDAIIGTLDSTLTNLTELISNYGELLDFSSIPNSVRDIYTYRSDFTITDFPSSLVNFSMAYNQITAPIPEFPQTLRTLNLSDSRFTSITYFPDSLNGIYLRRNNNLSSLPPLPVELDTLLAISCSLTQVNFSSPLIYLDVSGNNISSIDSLPSTLVYAGLMSNDLDSLPSLSPSLDYLNAGNNNLHRIPPLPATIRRLYIDNNPLVDFPSLPTTLEVLYCSHTVSCLPYLPDSLRIINYDYCIPNRPVNMQEPVTICSPLLHYYPVVDSIAGCNDSIVVMGNNNSILWSSGDTSDVIYNVCPGIFTCTITADDGCYYSGAIELGTALYVSYNIYNECGSFSSSFQVNVAGGSPPFIYISLHTNDTINPVDYYSNVSTSEGWEEWLKIIDGNGLVDSIYIICPPTGYPSLEYVSRNALCPSYNNGYYFSNGIQGSMNECLFEGYNLTPGVYTAICDYEIGCQEIIDINIEYDYNDCDSIIVPLIKSPDCGLSNGAMKLYGVSWLQDSLGNGVTLNYVPFNQYYTDTILSVGYYTAYASIDGGYGVWSVDIEKTITISYPSGCTANYPGDANNDGVANNVDLLSIGLAFNDTGFVRVDTTITWDGKYVMDWANSFADSVNHKHADCNGDGIVNDDDTVAVLQNYNFTHSNRVSNTSIASGNTTLSIDVNDTLTGALYQEAALHFENALGIADSIYGIAFSVTYDPSLINPATFYFEHDSGLFGTGSSLYLQKNNESTGRIDFAFTFTDHFNRSAEGFLGKLKFKLYPDSWTIPMESVIEVNNVYAINAQETEVIINNSYDSLLIIQCLASGYFTNLFVLSHPYCSGGTQWNCTGSLFAGVYNGTPPYSYEWFGFPGYDNDTLSGQCSIEGNIFGVVVTDAQGCTTYGEEDRSNDYECPPWVINYSIDSISCPGMENGQICVWWPISWSCPWVKKWSNGANTDCIDDLSVGIYTCTIVQPNNNSCYEDTIEVLTFNLQNPDNSFPVTVIPPDCGLCNGSLTLSSNNTSTLIDVMYNWNSLSGFTLDSICADSSYRFEIYYDGYDDVCVTDTIIDVLCVQNPCSLQANVSVTNSCDGLCNGSIQISVAGNTGNVTYDWSLSIHDTLCSSMPMNDANPDSLTTGNYICIVTDSAGCTDTTSSVNITSSEVSVTYNVNYESCTVCDGSIDLTVLNGTPPYSFLWSDNTTFEDLLNKCTYYNSFHCMVTDSLGCDYFFEYETPNCPPNNTSWIYDADCPDSFNGRIEYGAITPSFYGCNYSGYFLNPICGIQGYDNLAQVHYVESACPGIYTFLETSRMGCDTTYINILLGYQDAPAGGVTISYPVCNSCNGSILALDNGDTINTANEILSWTVNGAVLATSPAVLTGLCVGDTIDYYMTSYSNGCFTYGKAIIDSCEILSYIATDEKAEAISIHPNPNHGAFTIRGIEQYHPLIIEIISSDGRTIYVDEIKTGEELPVELKILPGVYICRISSEKISTQLKFIVY